MVPEQNENKIKNKQESIHRLAAYFADNEITILNATGVPPYSEPESFINPGYGDQKKKKPDIVGIRHKTKEYFIGITKTKDDRLDSASALTEYDLYLNYENEDYETKLCILLPSDKLQEFNLLITHYLHSDYWSKIIIITFD